jgi:hypothetical protein
VEECTYFWGVNTSWGINTAESKRPLNQEDNQAPQPTETLAKMHVKEQKGNKKLLNDNRKLLKTIRVLRIKLRIKNPKPRAHPGLRVLSEIDENLNEDPKE